MDRNRVRKVLDLTFRPGKQCYYRFRVETSWVESWVESSSQVLV